jgi:hypothetical protein
MAAPTLQMEPENENEPFGWLAEYQSALTEADPKLLPNQVAKARELIVKRRLALRNLDPNDREIKALEIALKTLRVLHNNQI